jgi:hypothetical protein
MAISAELQAELDDLQGMDIQKELAELNQPEAPVEVAPQGAAPVVAPRFAPPAVTPSAPPIPEDPDSFGSAVGRGIDNLQANAWGTVQAVGEASGSPDLTDLGTQGVAENKEEAAQYGTPSARSYKDVDPLDAGSVGQYVKNVVGESVGSMGVSVGSALAGAKAGSMAPGLIGKVGGTIAGGFLGGLGINIGAVQNQMKEIDPEASHPWTAILTGAGLSTLDAVGAKMIAEPLLKHIGKDATYSALRQMGLPRATAIEGLTQAAKGAGVGAAYGAGIGATQSAVQDVVAGTATGKPLSPGDILDHAIDAALGGAIGDGAARAGTNLTDHIMTQADGIGSAVDRSGILGKASAAVGKAADKVVPPNSLLRTVWQTLGSEATAKIDPLAAVSPMAKEFKDNFRPDQTGETTSKRSIFEDQDITSGKWRTKFNDVTKGLNAKDLDALLQEVSQPKANLQSQKAKDFRAIMDEIHGEAINRGGLKANYLDGMLPLQLNPKKLSTPEAFAAFRPYFKDDVQTNEAIQSYVTKMADPETRGNTAPEVGNSLVMNPQTGKWEADPRFQKNGPEGLKYGLGQGDTVPKFGHLEESRAFPNVPQHVLNQFVLNKSAKAKLREVKDYAEGAAHRIAFAERFGPSGEKANLQIAAAVKEAQDAGVKVTSEQIDRMFDLVNSYNGMYGRIKNENVKKAAGMLSGVTVLSRLPLSGISTLTELAIPFAKAGIRPALAEAMPTIVEGVRQSLRTIIRGIPPSETQRFMADLGMDLESATSLAAQRLGENIWNKNIQSANRFMFLANGMSVMTHFNRIFSTKVAERTFKNHLNDLAGGLPFTSANGANKLAQLREMGIEVRDQAHALSLIAPSTPSERMMAKYQKETAIKRFVSTSVLEPTFADKPLWMSNGLVGTMGLLKGYPAAYGNTILPMMARRMSIFQQGNSMRAIAGIGGIAFTAGLMMSLGAVQDELKSLAKGAGADTWQDTRTPAQKMIDVGSQQLPLQLSIAVQAATGFRKGYSTGDQVIGPIGGVVTDAGMAAYKTIASFEDDPSAGHIAKFLFQTSPLRPFKGLQEPLEEAFDIGE